MPVTNRLEEVIQIPEGVTVNIKKRAISVSGPNGEIDKVLRDHRIKIEKDDNTLTLSTEYPTKRELALFGTYRSHINNMIKGAQEDFTYKLKIIYSHFPVKVRVEQDKLVIENFIGESKPRKAKIIGETKINIQGDIVTVSGNNIEDTGQTAANIEAVTKIKKVDPRVFQDGIYIIEKSGKTLR